MMRRMRRMLVTGFVIIIIASFAVSLIPANAVASTSDHSTGESPLDGGSGFELWQRGMALQNATKWPVRVTPERGGAEMGHLTPGEIYPIQPTDHSDGVSRLTRVELHGREGWVNGSVLAILPEEPTAEEFTNNGVITGAAGRGLLSGISDNTRWTLFRFPHPESRGVATLSPGEKVAVANSRTLEVRTGGLNRHLMTPVRTSGGTVGWTYDANIYLTGNTGNWDSETLEEHMPVLGAPVEGASYVCQLYAGEQVRIGGPFDQYLPVDHGSDVGYIKMEDSGRFRDRIAAGIDSLRGIEASDLIPGSGEGDGDEGWVTAEEDTAEPGTATGEGSDEPGGVIEPGLVSCAELAGREAPAAAKAEAEEVEEEEVAPAVDSAPGDSDVAEQSQDVDPGVADESAPEQAPADEGTGFSWWLPVVGGAGLALLLLIGSFIAKRRAGGEGAGYDEGEGVEASAPRDPAPAPVSGYEDYEEPATQQMPAVESYDEYDEYDDAPSSAGDPLAALFNQRSED